MAITKVSGANCVLKRGSTAIGLVYDGGFDRQAETKDVTTWADTHKKSVSGLMSATADLSFWFDPADATQTLLEGDVGGDEQEFVLQTGGHKYTFDALVTGFAVSGIKNGEYLSANIKLEVTSAIVKAAVT